MLALTSPELALCALLIAASVRDLMVRRIPNTLLLCGLIVAAVLQLFAFTPLSLLTTGLAGLAVGLLLFLPLYLLRGMAAGDVKLMAVVGAFTGPELAWQIALATCCYGGVMALMLVLVKGNALPACRNVMTLLRSLPPEATPRRFESVGSLPYGLAIALGSFTLLYLRHS